MKRNQNFLAALGDFEIIIFVFYADLHIHSKYSRATSKDLDLERLSLWARRKGIQVLGTGDFTHPAWMTEIKEKLVPVEPGLFALREDLEKEIERHYELPPGPPTRFMLEVEISTIYKKGDKTRKVHHLIYAPDLDKADRIVDQLSRIGNLKADGRPILGLDSRNLLEITLQGGEGCCLIPAHVWTPWFSALGSKSGFDAIEECYGDLSPHIFAIETGLSSDPLMNRTVSSLDRFTLVSNSDAHSPGKVGREASVFHCELNYHAIMEALQNKEGYGGTVEFFPEEGKYHMDGCRNCGIRLNPKETQACGGRCPTCGKPVTIGVMNRVTELADRDDPVLPPQEPPFSSFIPLPEVLSEIEGVGVNSKKIRQTYENVVRTLGSEIFILGKAPIDEVEKSCSALFAEALRRMREGQVIREPGYDGEYGVIRLFEKEELKAEQSSGFLFDISLQSPDTKPQEKSLIAKPSITEEKRPKRPQTTMPKRADSILDHLDSEQREAAAHIAGPLLIVAGPGTGKTRTLTHRIAHLIKDHTIPSEQCLAITFTNRAAKEMQERLVQLLPDSEQPVPVMTFHSLGLSILKENGERVGLPLPFRVIDEKEQLRFLKDKLSLSATKAKGWLRKFSHFNRIGAESKLESEEIDILHTYRNALRENGLVDFDDLIRLPVSLLSKTPDLVQIYRDRYRWISVDEFQDVDERQYRLLQLLCPPEGNLCAIGDPDQAIYGFRGSDVRFFQRFADDFPDTRKVYLSRNYRSTTTIVNAAIQAIAPATLEKDRTLRAVFEAHRAIEIHQCPAEGAEAESVVHSIEQMMGGISLFSLDSKRVGDGENRSLSFSDFAVLYRTDNQAEVLQKAFDHSGIPYQKRGHTALTDHPIVEMIIEGLSLSSVQGSLVDRLTEESQKRILEGENEIEIRSITQHLQSFATAGNGRLDDFLSRLAMASQTDLWDPRAERVSLLTLHASKGLEFPVVFIVGCEDGILPLHWGDATDSNIDEERRLFFVGMTRAQEHLCLLHAKARTWRGERKKFEPSPFLQDIEKALLQITEQEIKQISKPRGHQLDLFE